MEGGQRNSDLTLEKVLGTIEVGAQYNLAIAWIEAGFPIWDAYARDSSDLDYYDGVGNHYGIEKNILFQSIELVKSERNNPGTKLPDVQLQREKLHDHIISINRGDWEPPEAVDRIFCSTFNLLSLFTSGLKGNEEEVQLNLIINQAADALLTGTVRTLDELNKELQRVRSNNRKKTEAPDGGK